MVDKEKLDNFLKEMNIELFDCQKDILLKMLNDPGRYTFVFPRGSGYSAARTLANLFGLFLEEVERARKISLIDYEMRNGARLAPTIGGKPIPLILDKLCDYELEPLKDMETGYCKHCGKPIYVPTTQYRAYSSKYSFECSDCTRIINTLMKDEATEVPWPKENPLIQRRKKTT